MDKNPTSSFKIGGKEEKKRKKKKEKMKKKKKKRERERERDVLHTSRFQCRRSLCFGCHLGCLALEPGCKFGNGGLSLDCRGETLDLLCQGLGGLVDSAPHGQRKGAVGGGGVAERAAK